MKAPTMKTTKKIEYVGKIVEDMQVDIYTIKGDACMMNGEITKVLSDPAEKKIDYPVNSAGYKMGMEKIVRIATVQFQN